MATWTARGLARRFVVTSAVRRPVAFGFTLNVIVSVVAVDAVTVPIAPLLKTTLLFPGIKEKPKPLIVIVVARIDRLAVLRVTTGVTLATCILHLSVETAIGG